MRKAWILAVLGLLGCDAGASVVERPGEPAVVYFDANDAEMSAAIRQARESVEGFVAEIPALREQGDYFSVKVPIVGTSGTEHIWLHAPEFRNGSFHGTVGNEPLSGPLKLGDPVSTPLSEISDWMAVRNGDLYGGFTVFVARSRMSPEQREEFDKSVDFRLSTAPRTFTAPNKPLQPTRAAQPNGQREPVGNRPRG